MALILNFEGALVSKLVHHYIEMTQVYDCFTDKR